MVLFREVQRFRQPWLWVLLLGTAGWFTWAAWQQLVGGEAVGTNPMGNAGLLVVWLFAAVALPAFFLYLNLRTEVRDDGIHLRFSPLHLRDRSYPLETLARVEAVRYNPLLEYGGWGIRIGRRGWAYNVSGRDGIRLTFVSGKELLIGTRKPGAFLDAVQEARSRAP